MLQIFLNVMSVVGILFTLTCLILFLMLVISSFKEEQFYVPDPRRKRKDD